MDRESIIAIFIVAIVRIVDNTEKIILHWDFWGNITSYGSKYYIIFLPIISLIIYALFRYYKRKVQIISVLLISFFILLYDELEFYDLSS